MKIVHTADWHLGKLVQGVYMTEDQRYTLERFIQQMAKERPDAIIIAGDVYDRAIPPVEAVELFDDVVTALAHDLQIPVFAIAGNHDSPTRLQFGRSFMSAHHYYVAGQLDEEIIPIELEDEYGPVHIHLIPYVDPSVARFVLQDETITTHDIAMQRIVERMTQCLDPSARHIAVAHAFVTKAGEANDEMTSDSERPLAIGGSEYVNCSHFEPFHYTALGHLHQAHHVGDETIRYAGSLLKYSKSERHHQKGYYVVELDGNGAVEVEKVAFEHRRDVRVVEGTMEQLLQEDPSDDYVFVTLLDEISILHPMEKIRTVYPNAMHIEHRIVAQRSEMQLHSVQTEKLTDVQRFEAFIESITGEKPSATMRARFEQMMETLEKEERAR